MECEGKFYFTSEQLKNTPSTKDGIFIDDERKYQIKIATFLQALGEKLKTPQLCINTAIVFVKRFFMYHSMKKCLKNQISLAALFLACKTENFLVKSEEIIHQYLKFLSPNEKHDVNSEFRDELESLRFNEFLILMTLGFDVAIEHPHLHIVKHASIIQVEKDVLKLAYFTASKSLHLTSLCLQYTAKIVACFSIHLAALKFQVKIPNTDKNQPWFSIIEKNMTHEFLDDLTKCHFNLFENHQQWSSIAKKMVTRRIATQTPHLNLNLSIGISTKRLSVDIPENLESSFFKINKSKSDCNENLHSTYNNLKNTPETDNPKSGISSTLKNLQLKFDNHVNYFSTPNQKILQTLLRENCLTPNEKETNFQSPFANNCQFLSDISRENSLLSFSSFDENFHLSSSQNNHSTPKISKITESSCPENYQLLTPNNQNNELSFSKEKPRRNFLKNLESSNVDHLTSIKKRTMDSSLFQNYSPNDHQLNSVNYKHEIWQPFLPQNNNDFQKNERCQQISLKRQSYDLNDSIVNKRRCLSGVDTFPSTVPQYKFNFF